MRFFSGFLHANRDEWEKNIDKVLANGQYRLKVELRDLDKQQPGLARKVLYVEADKTKNIYMLLYTYIYIYRQRFIHVDQVV